MTLVPNAGRPGPIDHRTRPIAGPPHERTVERTNAMRKITGKIATFVLAAALTAFVSACTNSPFAPDQGGDGEYCYTVNGHIICAGDN